MKDTTLLIAILLFAQLVNSALPVKVEAEVVDGFFNPNVNGEVFTTAVQSTGNILVGGSFSAISSTTRSRIGRLNPDGSLDHTFDPGANGAVRAIVVQPNDKILVGGDFTSFAGVNKYCLARLHADGTLDTSFTVRVDGSVHAIALQEDGKIIIGGDFNGILVNSLLTSRNKIARLNANGTLDTSFDPGAPGGVRALTVQKNGKILVGGDLTNLAGVACDRIGRLNADGTRDATFTASTNSTVNTIAVQADGRILIGGVFSSVNGVFPRGGIARLNSNGSLDPTVAPTLGRNHVKTIAIQSDGKILFGGWFSTVNDQERNRVARLDFDGSLEAGFAPRLGASDKWVNTLAVQPDGRILVGGTFTSLGGSVCNRLTRFFPDGSRELFFPPALDYKVSAISMHPNGGIMIGGDFAAVGSVSHQGIARIRENGVPDHAFTAFVADPGYVFAIAVQPDGKILVGGDFSNMNYESRSNIGRLNADGLLDSAFSSNVNGPVYAIAQQPDGKILIGGDFTQVDSTNRSYIARLNTDGSRDDTFVPPEVGGVVRAIGLQSTGQVLIGGDFTYVASSVRYSLARLNPTGTLDSEFVANASHTVRSIVVQPDDKILVAGDFTSLHGQAINRIGRLNANGTRDTSFITGPSAGANDTINTMALQADGKILVGGAFTQLHNVACRRIGRLHDNGTMDTNFLPDETNDSVLALALQSDGKLLAGGRFTILNGSSTPFLGRIDTDESAYQEIDVDSSGTEILWTIRGPMPDFSHVTFETSTNGVIYSPLGNATRISGGWLIDRLNLPKDQNIFVRARGFYGSGSGSICESVKLSFLTDQSNTDPVLRSIGNKSIAAGSTLIITVQADDADGNVLRYSATGAP